MLSSCISKKIIYDEQDLPSIGQLSFEHFVIENWNTTSLESEAAQKTDLVKTWLALGSQGRLKYHHLQDAVWSTGAVQLPTVPPGVPEYLQTPQQRAQVYNERPNTMWVRSWYGNDKVSREMADKEYVKLCKHTEDPPNHGSHFIRGNWAFEDHESLLSDLGGAPTEAGVTPAYVQALLELYPDVLEGGGGLRPKNEAYIQSGQEVGK
ncbi:hypothetical protein BKA65DRAFT_536441 [Rhexocercosporidium sp. MPI-PUGE-AT-0058]|nr:hypothetical protein BKA65DRAFT_536441 [Rhexocercosporidium sp. MPI-PUGE-AT-0058]